MTVIMAALLALVLTACTQADSGNNAGAGSTSAEGSGTITGGDGGNSAGTADNGGTTDNSGTAGNTSGLGTGDLASGTSGESASSGTVEDSTPDEMAGLGTAGGAALPEENYSDDQFNAQNEDETDAADTGDDGWNGTYVSESGETLTISIVDASTVSFSFANAGLSGNAELKDKQAVYHGDDQHVAVFDYAGTDIQVSILSEEDYDASNSPLNGIYVRQG